MWRRRCKPEVWRTSPRKGLRGEDRPGLKGWSSLVMTGKGQTHSAKAPEEIHLYCQSKWSRKCVC